MERLRQWWKHRDRRTKQRLVFYPTLIGVFVVFGAWMLAMPGRSYRGPLPDLDDEQRRLVVLLKRDVQRLAGDIGERNMPIHGTLERAWAIASGEFTDIGYAPKNLRYMLEGRSAANIEATRDGSLAGQGFVVIGAHYDSARGSPGADDNASGVAVLFELARAFADKPQRRPIRFVAFTNEEPPYFWNPEMGSLHYAKACKERGEEIAAMVSLESLGYYRDEPGSQKYPPVISWFFPSRGDFVGFVGNLASRSVVREAIGTFRTAARFPSEGAALPSWVSGVGWSDQWSFWENGYPGIMITDTAVFRNPNYHTANDKPETLDYERLARVTAGLIAVVAKLAN